MQSWQLLGKAEGTGFGLICFFNRGLTYIGFYVKKTSAFWKAFVLCLTVLPTPAKTFVLPLSAWMLQRITFHSYGISLPPRPDLV